ncbi:IclR family transcriptional regulator [Microbacterium invictum]|uniref:IclR family transcriptional regulator n=1 Tax=Microbacterium invictum TaxID=515415 RepID=A0ABZ0VDK9_9MICO|nr:IclR family transcriptional regulator [Microbacterium invictum]WQB69892.1 IclR family transcriptional regulator [Microbacterium invictum]
MTEVAGDEPRLVGSDRVLAVLSALGSHPRGATLDQLSHEVSSPKPTVHRALAALRRAGFVEQIERGVYAIGDEFLRIAFQTAAERPDVARVRPVLDELTATFGETAHYAVLDGAEVVYRAKTDPPAGAVRLTSVVGGRNPASRTAVGKLLLTGRVQSEADLRAIVGDGPLDARTPRTITDVGALWRELELTRERGYAVDDQENELGITCVAVALPSVDGAAPVGAVSVSALAFRMSLADLVSAVPRIQAIVAGGSGPRGGEGESGQ